MTGSGRIKQTWTWGDLFLTVTMETNRPLTEAEIRSYGEIASEVESAMYWVDEETS